MKEFEILKVSEVDEDKIINGFRALLRGEDISFDDKGEYIRALHESKIREMIAEILRVINSPK